ncbi:MAG: hypothetical protein VKQ33_05430 [Candidatus Sericytochromatia bacterium]|nr:hypothetical protein [Candidatus Sericytochromatia bacterium]
MLARTLDVPHEPAVHLLLPTWERRRWNHAPDVILPGAAWSA